MTELRWSRANLYLAFLAFVLVTSAVIGATAQESSTANLRIINRTRSLEVIKVERDDSSVYLTFQNNYDKNVSGVVVSPQKGSTEMIPFANQNEIIAPGRTHRQSFMIYPSRQTRDIVVLAALLEDCSIDGDPKTIDDLKAQRRGEKAQSEKLLALITKFLNVPNVDSKTLDKLERELSELANVTSHASGEEGYEARVSSTAFVLVRVRLLQEARKRGSVDIRNELVHLANGLEAKKRSC